MLRFQRNSKGFTLIELLIVIAIIGILAAIALPAYMDYARKAKVQEVTSTMGAVKAALVAYSTEMSGGLDTINWTTTAQTEAGAGVKIPTKFISNFACDGDTSAPYMVMTATLQNLGGGIDGTTLVLRSPDDNLQAWEWTGGTIPAKYAPKN